MKHDAAHEAKQNKGLELLAEIVHEHISAEPKTHQRDITLARLKALVDTLKADDKA